MHNRLFSACLPFPASATVCCWHVPDVLMLMHHPTHKNVPLKIWGQIKRVCTGLNTSIIWRFHHQNDGSWKQCEHTKDNSNSEANRKQSHAALLLRRYLRHSLYLRCVYKILKKVGNQWGKKRLLYIPIPEYPASVVCAVCLSVSNKNKLS